MASLLLKKPRGLYLSSFKAVSRFAIDEITKYDGPYPYVDGLILRVTRNYSRVLVRHDPRSHGESGYTLAKLAHLWLNMFTNFSVVPLRLATFLGFGFSLVGLVVAAWFAIEKLRHPELPVGWASLVCSLLVIGGVQLFALGMIGEYLGRLFLKVNGQPQYVVRDITGGAAPERPARPLRKLKQLLEPASAAIIEIGDERPQPEQTVKLVFQRQGRHRRGYCQRRRGYHCKKLHFSVHLLPPAFNSHKE